MSAILSALAELKIAAECADLIDEEDVADTLALVANATTEHARLTTRSAAESEALAAVFAWWESRNNESPGAISRHYAVTTRLYLAADALAAERKS